jgi:hypothetical protein
MSMVPEWVLGHETETMNDKSCTIQKQSLNVTVWARDKYFPVLRYRFGSEKSSKCQIIHVI